MDTVRIGIIGCGGMGSSHIGRILHKDVDRCKITAVCDVRPDRIKEALDRFPETEKPAAFEKSEELIRSGLVDAVVIATPHYFHPTVAIDAFNNGLNVMSEKPIGVYTKIIHDEIAAAKKSGKVFGVMFNQRTNPAYRKMKEIIDSGELGEIVRVNWIITDWFRSQAYYDSGDWRATWAGEGGGVLLNQCPHQIDLLQWICGVPKRVRAFAGYGKYHNVEVEDDVTAYFEYENGATGLFITTTGECPGTNRFEISGDMGKLVAEKRSLKHFKNAQSTKLCRETTSSGFPHINVETTEYLFDNGGTQHNGVLKAFVDSIIDGTPLIADGEEGINGLTLSNAMHMSSWINDWVDIPLDEDRFKALLDDKIKNSSINKAGIGGIVNFEGTFDGTKQG